jgi:hypothetical protein
MAEKSEKLQSRARLSPTLAEAVAQYGRDAYLLTIADNGPHTSFVSVDLKGNVVACAIGKSAARNMASVPNVSLFLAAKGAGRLCSRRWPYPLTPCSSDCRRVDWRPRQQVPQIEAESSGKLLPQRRKNQTA